MTEGDNHTHYTQSTEKLLTLDQLTDLLEKVKPLPFVAFTFNPKAFEAMKAQATSGMGGELGSVRVYKVDKQKEGCLRWGNERMLRNYLIGMEAI